MTRTTDRELDALARIMGNQDGQTYSIQRAYGQPRVYRAGGSVEVSPRLPAGDLARWMRAYIQGQDSITSAPRRLAEDNIAARFDAAGVDPFPAWIERAGKVRS